MSDIPIYELQLSAPALLSLKALPLEAQANFAALLSTLGNHLTDFPDRVWHDERNGTYVYRHPVPRLEVTYRLEESRGLVTCLHVAAPFTPLVTVFVSYSHKDKNFLQEFRKYIFHLEQQGKVEFFDDGKIKPGEEWEREIQRALTSSKAAVLIVTQDFISSEFISTKELPVLRARAKDGTMSLFWIPLRHATYEQTGLLPLQALANPNTPLAGLRKSKREAVLTEISRVLQKHLLAIDF
jgi:hypothetical protein